MHSSLQHSTSIQAVIFDLDGVLLDTEWLAFLAWRALMAEHGVLLDDSVFDGIAGLDDIASAEYVMARAGIAFDTQAYVERIKQHMLARVSQAVEPMTGAVELVREFDRRGLPLAIASNAFTDYVGSALTSLNLRPFFRVLVGADLVEQPKPAPDAYQLAAQRLGADPARCLAIEDSRVGMQAASAAGMRVIGVPDRRINHRQYPEAWRIYDSLVAVRDDLERVLG